MADEKPAPTEAPKQDPQQPPADPKDLPAPRSYSQEEVDRITDKVRRNARRDAERRFERDRPAAAPAPEKKDPPADPDPAPKRDDFADYESFQVAVAEHAGRKASREETAKSKREEQERAQRETAQKAETNWRKKIEAAERKHDDFHNVLEDGEEVLTAIYNAPARTAITESDIGPEIVRYLCLPENAEEAKRILALPGYKQAAEIVKIEEKLTAAPKPAEDKGDDDPNPDAGEKVDAPRDPKTGQFKKDPPPPINPGSGRPATTSSLPSDKDDAETWRRKELARMERKRQGK